MAQKAALRADVRATSLETLRHLVSVGQGETLAPLLAYADWRRLGDGLDGSKIVGGGASRQVRLVFRRGSPRRAALEALAASLRGLGGAGGGRVLAGLSPKSRYDLRQACATINPWRTAHCPSPRPALKDALMVNLANPTVFVDLSRRVLPWLAAATAALFVVGLWLSFAAPPDYQQGETVKIMYLHVPAAWMATFVYGVMAAAALGTLVWRHPLADAAQKAAAPLGAGFTFICLATGSLWGKPMWGTYWVWDARLTSVWCCSSSISA